ncbi:MAG: hypothetical protein K8F30_04610 [Taibaiella sp.]|nr:hypothetical protein [Taibaiella sp.]
MDKVNLSWASDELKRRKDLYRRLWSGKPVDHIPVDVRIEVPSNYSVRDQFLDGTKQLEASIASAIATWEQVPSSDCIAASRPDVGCSCLASAFGSKYYWGDNPDQTPGVKEKIIYDIEEQVDLLNVPDPYKDGWLPEGLKRIGMFAEAGQGIIPVSLLDAAGGVNVAADIMGVADLLIGLRLSPEAVHKLLAKIQQLYINVIRAGIKAAGGEENITTTDFLDVWFPEGMKGHVSDDICANFGPDTYLEFSAPYHALIFKEFGCGGLHNCGPNPCHEAYLSYEFSPRAIDLSDTYSHADLANLKKSFKHKALIYLRLDSSRNAVECFTEIMNLMVPDVVVVPVLCFKPGDEAEETCKKLLTVAREYAANREWGFV